MEVKVGLLTAAREAGVMPSAAAAAMALSAAAAASAQRCCTRATRGLETVDDGGADIAAVAALGAGGFDVDRGGVEVIVDALVNFFDRGEAKPLLLSFGLVVFGDHRYAVGLLVSLVGELEALSEGEVVEGANGLSLCAVVARNGGWCRRS